MRVKTYKQVYKDSINYYNLCRLMSIEQDIHVSMSIRNLGKSFGLMSIIKNDLNRGKDCQLLRWDLDEMNIQDQSLMEFLSAYSEKHPEQDYIKIQSSSKYMKIIMNKTTGQKVYILGVKYSVKYKGLDFNLQGIYYDEFIQEFNDTVVRRKTEFDKFMSLYVTLKRDKNPRVIFCGNNIDWFNPYTKAWGIMPFNQGEIKLFTLSTVVNEKEYKFKVAWEMVKPTKKQIERCQQVEVQKGRCKNQEEYFKSVQWTQYNLIEKCPKNVKLENIQFKIGEKYITYRIYKGLYYFTYQKYRRVKTQNQDIRAVSKNEYRNKDYKKNLIEMYNNGLLRFSSGHVFNDFVIIMNLYRNEF